MSKFGGLFARKAGLFDNTDNAAPAANTAFTGLPDNPLDIDEELFSSIGAQIGGDNESLRNLMLDANAKMGELDTIKAAFGKLVDPLGKTLRAFEAEKAERVGLQTVLNTTRTAYGKLRNETAELEKKAASADSECRTLRQELTAALNSVRTLETTKAEIAIDVAARRAQIVDLESRLAQETGESNALRDDNRRLDERLTACQKRINALEFDLNGARQRLLMAEDEKRAQQSSLDKASAEGARLSRKLAESEASLNAAQGRLRHVEANFAEVVTERDRLVSALDESKERHDHEITSQRTRFEALQARVSDLEAERIGRESEFQEVDQMRASLAERSGTLTRAYTAKEAALARAEDTIAALNERVAGLENALSASKETAELQIEELNAAVRREKLERAVVEGALETGRKDFARLMREVMSLQRSQQAAEEPIRPRAANAA
jgi:crescentin